MATGSFADPLTTKDLVTLLVGAAALCTSVAVALFNIYVYRSKKSDDGRKAFEEAILGIATAKQSYESLRHEAGKKFDAPEFAARRVAIVDSRNFNLSKALQSVATAKFVTSSADNLLLAAALMESGRRRASVTFYRKALDLAADDYDRAAAGRVLGRAQFLSGDSEVGRATMLKAADLFTRLAGDPAFEPDRMLREVADTYLRLVTAELEAGVEGHLEEDLNALEYAAGRATGPIAVTTKTFAAEMKARALEQKLGTVE